MKIKPPVIDRAAAEKAMKDYADASARLAMTQSEQKLEINGVEEKYRARITAETAAMDNAQEILNQYADAFDEIFNGKKSAPLGVGTIGFRSNPAKLTLLDGWDWDKVVLSLDEDYIRIKQEVDKAKLLKDFKDDPDALNEVGLTIEQTESFFVKVD